MLGRSTGRRPGDSPAGDGSGAGPGRCGGRALRGTRGGRRRADRRPDGPGRVQPAAGALGHGPDRGARGLPGPGTGGAGGRPGRRRLHPPPPGAAPAGRRPGAAAGLVRARPAGSATSATSTGSPAPCAGVAEQIDYLRELGVSYLHLMPLLQPRGRRRTTAATRSPTTGAVRARPGHHGRPGAAGRRPARQRASRCASTWCSTTSRASTSGPRAARRGDPRVPRLLPHLPRPDPARRLRGHAAGGLPRLRARATSRWVDRSWRAGSGPRSTTTSGTSTGPTPTSSARSLDVDARPGQPRGRRAAAGRGRLPVEADGHRLPEPARGAHDRCRRCGRRCPDRRPRRGLQGRGDRRPGDLRGLPRHRPARGQGLRPRLPQQPDGAALVRAGDPRRPAGPSTRCGRSPPKPRDHRLGAPTCAATTTSAGRSPTPTPPRSG